MNVPRRRFVALALAAALAATGCGLLRRSGKAEAERPAPIDVNTAPLRKVERLPGVTPSMARKIVAGRPYDSLDALVDRGILTERELDRIRDHIMVQGGAR